MNALRNAEIRIRMDIGTDLNDRRKRIKMVRVREVNVTGAIAEESIVIVVNIKTRLKLINEMKDIIYIADFVCIDKRATYKKQ